MAIFKHAGVIALALLSLPGCKQAAADSIRFTDHHSQCAGKRGWSEAAAPTRIFGNVYDVGTCGVVALLITGSAGHILIDAATAKAAPSIIANIQRLGFRASDVKLLLSSHEHLDHAGGLAEVKRATDARLLAVAAERTALESGRTEPDDPQSGKLAGFPGVHVDQVLRDGETVTLGLLRLTAHTTPGHALGSTTWSWRSCEGETCHAIVYADSLNARSSDRYRFSDHPAYVATFKASINKIAALPCDLVISPHPGASHLDDRLAGARPLSDAKACVTYASAGLAKLDRRLASERPSRIAAR